jgi:hypothetical protein
MEIISYGSCLLLYELRPGEHSEHTQIRFLTCNTKTRLDSVCKSRISHEADFG